VGEKDFLDAGVCDIGQRRRREMEDLIGVSNFKTIPRGPGARQPLGSREGQDKGNIKVVVVECLAHPCRTDKRASLRSLSTSS
jgi:hypothetical protein